MRTELNVSVLREPVLLTTNLVYGYRRELSGAAWRPLHLSLLRTQVLETKPAQRLPVVVWLCGGGFIETDPNVSLPELVWFAQRGYAVVSVEYSTTAMTQFPDQLVEIKQAIRYLRAHANEYLLDTDRLVVMGESAGGYLAALVGLSNGKAEYERGEHLELSSSVNGAVAWYPVVRPAQLAIDPAVLPTPCHVASYPDLNRLVTPNVVPIMLLHGTADALVPSSESELLYQSLLDVGVDSELLVLHGAGHADAAFIQDPIKERIEAFIDLHIDEVPNGG